MRGLIASVEEGAASIARWQGAEASPSGDWQARVLTETPDESRVVEYTFDGPEAPGGSDAARTLVGKFYAGKAGAAAHWILTILYDALAMCTTPPALAVPEPLHYDPTLRLLVQEKVEGLPYTGLCAADDLQGPLRRAGRALACLHDLKLPPQPAKGVLDHLHELVRPQPDVLGEALPAHRAGIARAMEMLHQRDSEWHGVVACVPLHRDFHLRQLFAGTQKSKGGDPERVWVVDWDYAAWGDPAFDVAFMLAYLENHLADDDAAQAEAAFLGGYGAERAEPLQPRIPVYRAFNYLRRACRRFRIRDEGWEAELQR